MLKDLFNENKLRFLLFIKSISMYFFILLIINPSFTFCSSQSAMQKKIVNTRKEISNGLQRGNLIYFLCDYVLSGSGTTIIPMYMHVPGNIYYDKVFLYAFDIPLEKLTRLAGLNSTSSYAGRGSVKDARWAYTDSKIYVAYYTGWDTTAKKYIDDVFSLDIKTNTVMELKNDDKERVISTHFSSQVGKATAIVPFSRVLYYAGCVSHEAWQLPSPLDYSTMNSKEIERVIVEQLGDRAFQDAVFRSIGKSMSGKEAKRIILSMQKWNEKLPGHKQMIYKPYMEELSAKLSIAARINDKNNGQAKDDSANSMDLFTTAYTDNVQGVTDFLKTVDINFADNNGCTALMYAIFGNAPHTMEFLIRNGADIKRETKSGYTAWMFASGTELRQRYLGLTEK